MVPSPMAAEDRPARPGRVSLMRTAISLMGEHGYEGTSTRDIAAAAGVSVAALYYHFPSKQDLLREFLQEAHDVVVGRVEREVAAVAAPEAKLDAWVAAVVWSNIHDDWARQASLVAWREMERLEAGDQKTIARKRDQLVKILEKILADGAFATDEPREVARAILILCITVADPFSPKAPLAKVIELHQRLARALAATPPKG